MREPITPVNTLQRKLRSDLRRSFPGGRVIVAIDGMEGSGKTTFADSFAAVLAEDGTAVFRASMDGFHRPREERYVSGRHSPEGYYRDSFDYATFRRVLIDPFHEGAQTAATTGFQLAAWDVARDVQVESRWMTAPVDAVLVVDGVFLHRPELRALWDWSIWLDVPLDEIYRRLATRDGIDADPASPLNARYVQGQRLYAAEAQPRAAASWLIDNTDVRAPRLVVETVA